MIFVDSPSLQIMVNMTWYIPGLIVCMGTAIHSITAITASGRTQGIINTMANWSRCRLACKRQRMFWFQVTLYANTFAVLFLKYIYWQDYLKVNIHMKLYCHVCFIVMFFRWQDIWIYKCVAHELRHWLVLKMFCICTFCIP